MQQKLLGRASKVVLNLLLAFPLVCISGLQPAITNDATNPAPLSAGGNSCSPIITPDGRYVLFASSAENLILPANQSGLVLQTAPKLQLYRRDRLEGTTILVSANLTDRGGGNEDARPVDISTNGQYVLFESQANDLVPNDTNGVVDVFLRDMESARTLLVSQNTNGTVGAGKSWQSAMTSDGRFVAFASDAADLVPDDTNTICDVFVRDQQSGETSLVSVGAAYYRNWDSRSDAPRLTPDGRYVAFLSSAFNYLFYNVQSAGSIEVYVRDRALGVTHAVSTNLHGLGYGRTIAYSHALSDDGRYVAFEAHLAGDNRRGMLFWQELLTGTPMCFETNAPIAVTGYKYHKALDLSADGSRIAFLSQTGQVSHVYLWHAQTLSKDLLSTNTDGQAPSAGLSDWPTFDKTGRLLAYLSNAKSLVTNTVAEGFHLYLRDLDSGVTRLIDEGTAGSGAAKNFITAPSLSVGGRWVAFDCTDGDSPSADNNGFSDVFVRDTETAQTELISARDSRLPSTTPAASLPASVFSASSDGRYVALARPTDALTSGGSNDFRRVLVQDRSAGTLVPVALDTNGLTAVDGFSTDPYLSADGRWVLFASSAGSLTANDTNGVADVFVRDMHGQSVRLVSVNREGTGPGNRASWPAGLSADGRYALFLSRAGDIATMPVSSTTDVLYCRNLASGFTQVLTPEGHSSWAATPDLHYVAFGGRTGSLVIKDAWLGTIVYSNVTAAPGPVTHVGISPDGSRVAGLVSNQLWLIDRLVETNGLVNAWSVSNSAPSSVHTSLRFNADNRWLTFNSLGAFMSVDTNLAQDVYLFDFQNQSLKLVTQSVEGDASAGGASDSPTISPDGRFVVYRSFATNLVPSGLSLGSGIYLYDRQTDRNSSLSGSLSGPEPGNNCSFSPRFSGDGSTLLFVSSASDLVSGDFNQSGDLFVIKPFLGNPVQVFRGEIVFKPGSAKHPTLAWSAVSGRSYEVQYKSLLAVPGWLRLNEPVGISENVASVIDTTAGDEPRFYRILAY
jgi:Tol biopolymer transport system component